MTDANAVPDEMVEAALAAFYPIFYQRGFVDDEDRAEMRAALTAAFSIRDGYVLVPKEPTEAMIEAHFLAHAEAKNVFADVPTIWRAMLSAAPSTGEET